MEVNEVLARSLSEISQFILLRRMTHAAISNNVMLTQALRVSFRIFGNFFNAFVLLVLLDGASQNYGKGNHTN